jgi:glycosyltransferase involved in cell wall biosynthesis
MNASKPLRILHVIDWFYPQLGYQETFLSKAEREQGYDVYVLTSNLFDKTIYEANRGIFGQRKTKVGQSVERGIKTIRLPAFHLPIVNNLYLLGLEKVVAKLRPDVIICHGIVFLTAIRAARLKKRLPGVKLIFDDHMTYNATRRGIFRYIYALFKLAFTPAILKSSDAIVAVTHETKTFMEEVYGIPTEKISIIPIGVETTLFRRDPRAREKIRTKYGIANDDVVFIYAGKIIPEKGPHLLVEAALKILNEYPNVKIILVGGGKHDYKILVNKMISSSGFGNSFILIPEVTNEELYKYYSAADVGVWPLQCSIAMLEAMSCGLPLLISNNSGALERISEGNGLMYREGDLKDLAEKMKILLNPKLRKSMSLRAREFAEKNDWNIISKRFLELVDI